jgi:uncharacterized protein YggU (UPF0235/DUF167 family)
MKIFVKIKPNAKEEFVEKIDDMNFIVAVKEPPEKNKANKAVIRALSEYLKIAQQNIRIIIGHRSKQKIINIQGL